MPDLKTIDTSLAEHRISSVTGVSVNVGVSSTLVLAQSSTRVYALVVNDSDTTIYIKLGAAAVVGEGIRINANGGAYEINWSNLYTGNIYGIHNSTGNKAITVTQGTS